MINQETNGAAFKYDERNQPREMEEVNLPFIPTHEAQEKKAKTI